MSEVRLTNELWGGNILVFDSEDIETFSTPHEVEAFGERNGYIEQRFTGVSHLNLTFKQGCAPRWEAK